MSKRKLFITTFLIATAVFTAAIYFNRPGPHDRPPRVTRVSDQVSITSQLHPASVPYLRRYGIWTVVDIRPDGEAADQPSSADIERASHAGNMAFYYIPVPHETIPDAAVQALSSALENAKMGTVLYCRTGRRAVRLFALAEASRPDGPSLDSILEMVSTAGFSAEDLREAITHRISNRSSTKE
ncbi:beta-lactamase hydrolase domain-containing protein [Verrucomicrobiota bacterium sgz303538]